MKNTRHPRFMRGSQATVHNGSISPHKAGMTTSIILILAALSLTSCGYKSRLKSPAQIEAAEAKKAAKQAKKDARDSSEEIQKTEPVPTHDGTAKTEPAPIPPARGDIK